MIQKTASYLANKFFDENDEYPVEVYIYGIELILSSLIGTTLILVIGMLTHTFWESVIFMVSFSLIRIYTGGYHAMSYLRCNIITALSYIAVIGVLRYLGGIISNIYVMVGGYIAIMVLALIFAPVKHENKEITDEDKKKYKLISLIIITVIYSVSCVCFYIFSINEMLVIFPTCLTIDAAMVVSVINNNIKLRRKLR